MGGLGFRGKHQSWGDLWPQAATVLLCLAKAALIPAAGMSKPQEGQACLQQRPPAPAEALMQAQGQSPQMC